MMEQLPVIWDNKRGLWKRGDYVISPRLDSDGWDFFFGLESKQEVVARYCSGEGYWAFNHMTDEQRQAFTEMVYEITKKQNWGNRVANQTAWILRQRRVLQYFTLGEALRTIGLRGRCE
jgi:hypothetical protein